MTNSVYSRKVEFDNPFSYGTLVTGAEFAGREREIAELYIAMRSGKCAVLHSEKKMGKSSILAELAERYGHEFVFVKMSLRGISDEGKFIELLTREVLKASFEEMEELVPAIWELLSSARLRLAVLEDGTLGIVSKSETQAIVLSPRSQSIVASQQSEDINSKEIRICSKCGGPLKWIEKYHRYYCYVCKKYAPQRRVPKYKVGPSSFTFPRRLCPECGNDLTYIEKFGEYYCDQCSKYPLMEQKTRRHAKPDQEEIDEALDLPEKIAMQKKKRFAIILDDFQELLSFESKGLLDSMRARFELHTNVAYVFSGTGGSFLEAFFVRKDSPFRRFAHPVALGPLAEPEAEDYLVRRFRTGGGKLAPVWARRVVELTGGHPYYFQMVAHELFHISKTPDGRHIDAAARFAVMRNSSAYSAVWDSIRSPLHRRFLLGAAMEPNVSHSSSFIRRYGLRSRSHVQRIEKQLDKRGITREGEILDPLFVFWLRDIASA